MWVSHMLDHVPNHMIIGFMTMALQLNLILWVLYWVLAKIIFLREIGYQMLLS